MFKKILIANRGEIAVRIIKACREMGIRSAAVYSEADIHALHVRKADEAYLLGDSRPSESYLNTGKIIKLAKEIGADAIHPGYGFLSENASFIKEVEDNKIEFIGPSSYSVELMGKKTAARELMKESGVPIVPGTTKPVTSLDEAKISAAEIGYPVMLKASAGGGGKGMRKLFDPKDFEESFESAQSEALKAFGNPDIYIEKFIENPKHIEVQIIADKNGNYAHLFERECSVQRRHQKVIEEAPSVSLDEATREKITIAALNAAKACKYVNAGTIEFLMDTSRKFYFLEMNTRLQVEHPVTELITGIDIVKEQISIAAGNNLSFNQEDVKINGAAVECRIYAEDVENNFAPSMGKILNHKLPSGPGVRVDRGIDVFSDVSVFYDPLLSKLVTWGRDRDEAIIRMNIALSDYHLSGVITNIPALKWVLRQNEFLDGSFDIDFINRKFIPLLPDKWKKELHNKNHENAAALFSVLLTEKKKKLNPAKIENLKTNNWSNQNYE